MPVSVYILKCRGYEVVKNFRGYGNYQEKRLSFCIEAQGTMLRKF